MKHMKSLKALTLQLLSPIFLSGGSLGKSSNYLNFSIDFTVAKVPASMFWKSTSTKASP